MIQLILFSCKACGTMGRRKKNLSCLLPSRFLPFCFLLRPCFPILLTEQRKKKRKNVRDLTAKQISVCLFVCCCLLLLLLLLLSMATPANFKLFIPITLKLPKERLLQSRLGSTPILTPIISAGVLLSFSYYQLPPLGGSTFHSVLNSYKYKHSLPHKYVGGHL